LDLRIDLSIV